MPGDRCLVAPCSHFNALSNAIVPRSVSSQTRRIIGRVSIWLAGLSVGRRYNAPMVTEKVKQLAALEAKAKKLRAVIARELRYELSGLPAKYGFESVREFERAVRIASGAKKVPKRRKRRVRVTPEVKAAVVRALKDGKTAAAAAKEGGVSLSSVHLIKKATGLVKAQK